MASKTDVLITGYCRIIQRSLKEFNCLIPLSIIKICIKFYTAKSIISIAIGQCGNYINLKHFESLINQYNLSNNGFNNNKSSFVGTTYLKQKSCSNQFIPRCICIDLEPGI